VQDRHAEHGHHRVSDELLDRAPMGDECLPGDGEVAQQHLADGLGVG